MDRNEIIERLCRLAAEVWQQHDPDCHTPNDCFCGDRVAPWGGFQFDGESIEYIERVVREALAKEANE